MPQDLAWFDYQPISEWGLELGRPLDGWIDAPPVTLQEATLAHGVGTILRAGAEALQVRKLDLLCEMNTDTGLTLTARLLQRRTYLRALYGRLRHPVQIQLWDDPDRFVTGKLVRGTASGTGASEAIDPDGQVKLEFIATDPLYYDVQPWTRKLAVGQRTTIPFGDYGTRFQLLLVGVATSTLVRVRSGQDGRVLSEMTLTGSTGAGEYLFVDGIDQQIKRITGATVVDAYAWKGSSDRWFAPDPIDLPTIELVSSGGGWAIGRRGYLT